MHNNRTVNNEVKDLKKTFKTLLKYLGTYKIRIILVIIFAIGSAVFSIVGPKILGEATTLIFDGLLLKVSNAGGVDFTALTTILLTLLGLYIISMIFSYIQGIVMATVSQKVTYNLRNDISKKIHRMPLKYFETKQTGDTLSRITNDVDTISQSLDQGMAQIISSFVLAVGIIVMMFSINVVMTLVILVLIIVTLFVMMKIIKRGQIHFERQQAQLGNINGHIEETYAGHDIVKLYNGEALEVEKFNKTNEELYDSAWKSQFLSSIMMPMMQFVGNIGYVIVSIFGGYLVINGSMAIGDILSFTQYVRTFMQPLGQIAQVTNLLQSLMAAAERVFEFLDEEEEIPTISNPKELKTIKKGITFENVSFGYNKNKTIINNFSVDVKKGQKIAIVGPTGAGKTTIVKLLMRFYDVNSGSIKIDGIDIKDMDRNHLREHFGMVLQDTWLFSASIKDNMKFAKSDATDEEIEKACIDAHVDHFIRTLPNSYDVILDDETSSISAGQKQLLTIARVILNDPEILILDEATSSVDTRTEVLIQKAMDKLMENRTSFVIAHRLSTIRNADIILVMNDGDIIEQGSHDELLKEKGFYYNLYNSQFDTVTEE